MERASLNHHFAQRLVAHRGSPLSHPENTLAGVESACKSGAHFVEIDIQITADGVPILYHDDDLRRVSGIDQDVCQWDWSGFDTLDASYEQRFGEQFRGTPVSTLREFLEWTADWPDVRLFLEIKSHSLDFFGLPRALEWIRSEIVAASAEDRIAAVIGKSVAALKSIRSEWRLPIGWVLPQWNEAHRQIAETLIPEYIFCKNKRLPDLARDIWAGEWSWVVYPVNEPGEAQSWFDDGLAYVETDDIHGMVSYFRDFRSDP